MPSVTAGSPARRPDPRLARTTERLRGTVLDLLAGEGYHAVTIERVAAESGVARTTIYRRWGSRAEMVLDLALRPAGEIPPPPPTESLRRDVEELVDRALALIGSGPARALLPGLIGEVSCDPDLAERVRHDFVVTARPAFAAIVRRARTESRAAESRAAESRAAEDRAAGEQAVAARATELQALILGTVFAWVHLMPEEPAPQVRDRLVGLSLALLDAL